MRSKFLLTLAVMALLLAPSCLATQMTFAQFDVGTQNLFQMIFGNDAYGLYNELIANNTVHFTFLSETELVGAHDATFTFDAKSYEPVTTGLPGGYTAQSGYSGAFAFVLLTPVNGKSNLLSGTFGPYTSFYGFGSSGSIGDSTPPATEIQFTSDFVVFGPGDEAFFLSMSSILPSLAVNSSGFYRAFAAAGTGTFSANVIPEPVTLVLVGGGLLALGLLRRRMHS